MSKRLLFGDDPADDAVRQRLADETRQFLERFKFTIPTKRRNRLGVGPHWDSAWGSSLRSAADDANRMAELARISINSATSIGGVRHTPWPSVISLPSASAAHVFARASALWLLAYPAFLRALVATR